MPVDSRASSRSTGRSPRSNPEEISTYEFYRRLFADEPDEAPPAPARQFRGDPDDGVSEAFFHKLFTQDKRPAAPAPPRPARPFNPANPEEISTEEFYRQLFAETPRPRSSSGWDDREMGVAHPRRNPLYPTYAHVQDGKDNLRPKNVMYATGDSGEGREDESTKAKQDDEAQARKQAEVNAEIARIYGSSSKDINDPLKQPLPPSPTDGLGTTPHHLGSYRHQEQPVVVPGDPLLYSKRSLSGHQAPVDATTENKGLGGSISTFSGLDGSATIEVYGQQGGSPTSWGMAVWDKTGEKDGPTGWDLYEWRPMPEAVARRHPLYKEVNDRFFYEPLNLPKGGKR